VSDSTDSLQKLEERLIKALDLFQRTQEENRSLRQQVEKLKADLKEQSKEAETLDRELVALRREREEVRSRLEKLLERIDVLTSNDSEA
jgi:cell division septum initiation protein DivIVA